MAIYPQRPNEFPLTLEDAITSLGGIARLSRDSAHVLACYSKWEVASPQFVSSDGTGFLQVTCSGDAILSIRPTNHIGRTMFYIVRDDSAGEAWAFDQRGNAGIPTRPRPHAILRLVASA